MSCFGQDIPEFADVRGKGRKAFGGGDNCQSDVGSGRAICEDDSGC